MKRNSREEKMLRTSLHSLKIYSVALCKIHTQSLRLVIIHERDYLPIMNNRGYKSKSATQKNIAILGYYYALLRFSLESSSNIPRYLVIDTLRQDDLSPALYEKVLRKYKELEEIYHKGFQLFIVVRDPMDFLRDDEIIQLVEGQHLLLVERANAQALASLQLSEDDNNHQFQLTL